MSLATSLWAPTGFGFLLVLMRTVALFAVVPIFGTRSVPGMVRVMIALPVSFAVFAGAGFPSFADWQHIGALLGAVATETVVGLAAGVGMKLIVDAAFTAGHLASTSMGLGFGSLIDPMEGADTTAVAELYLMMALAALLAAGGHREIVAFIARTSALPPGAARDLGPLVLATANHALAGVVLAVRLSFPVLAAVLVGNVALGIVGRSAPQLSLGSLGFSVTIITGGGIAYLTAPLAADIVSRAALAALRSAG